MISLKRFGFLLHNLQYRNDLERGLKAFGTVLSVYKKTIFSYKSCLFVFSSGASLCEGIQPWSVLASRWAPNYAVSSRETPDDCYVDFVDKPNVDGPAHPMEAEIKGYDDWTAMYGYFMPHDVKTKTKGSKIRDRDQTFNRDVNYMYYTTT